MPTKDEPLGQIDISTITIATIANQAVNQCYGVVGMASKSVVNGIASLLTRDSYRGIDVHVNGEQIDIDIYVIIEYGIRIRTVAESIQHTVKFHVSGIYTKLGAASRTEAVRLGVRQGLIALLLQLG